MKYRTKTALLLNSVSGLKNSDTLTTHERLLASCTRQLKKVGYDLDKTTTLIRLYYNRRGCTIRHRITQTVIKRAYNGKPSI